MNWNEPLTLNTSKTANQAFSIQPVKKAQIEGFFIFERSLLEMPRVTWLLGPK
jgi:hypothetical protein